MTVLNLACGRPRPRRIGLMAGGMLAALSGPCVADQTATKSGGDWFDAATWTQGVPSAMDFATLSAGHTVTVDRLGAGAYVLNNDGVLEIKASGPAASFAGTLAVGLQLNVGYASNGQLKLSSGGRLASTDSYVGSLPGSSGLVRLDGSPLLGGERATWINSGELIVGSSGFGPATGVVQLVNGSIVNARNTFVGSGVSTGTVDVNGSTWSNSNLFSVGTGGAQGSLFISNGGRVNDFTGSIGYGSGSTSTLTGTLGTALVDGASWHHASDFHVGAYARAQLSLVNGAQVDDQIGYVGYGASSVASAMVRDSSWSNAQALFVGYYGDGTLLIDAGGSVSSPIGILGRYGQARGAVTVDGGSWSNAGELYVGHGVTGLPDTHPDGRLLIRNGGLVTSSTGFVGYGIGSTGTVTVTGPASSWRMVAELDVGGRGSGELTIADGGLVASPAVFLGQPGSGRLQLQGTAGRRGALETAQISGGTGAGPHGGSIAVDGGLLRATANQPDFLRNLALVDVLGGGLFVDSAGHDIGIAASLLGSGGLHKLGSGTLRLAGSSALGGLSEVEAGTLAVNGVLTGDLQVDAGATLGGIGRVNGSVAVKPGGMLSPGNSPGTLSLAALTMAPGAHLLIEVGPSSDLLVVSGDLVLAGSIDFAGDPALFKAALPSFISYGGSFSNLGVAVGALPAGVDRSRLVLDFGTPGRIGLMQAVPEPGQALLLSAGLALLLALRSLAPRRGTAGPRSA